MLTHRLSRILSLSLSLSLSLALSPGLLPSSFRLRVRPPPFLLRLLDQHTQANYGLKQFEACLADCAAAIDACRRTRAAYATVAKVFCQKATAHAALGDLVAACAAYEDALMEDRTRATEKKLKKAQQMLKKQQELAYLSPEEGDLAKARGNEFVKVAKWPDAIRECVCFWCFCVFL